MTDLRSSSPLTRWSLASTMTDPGGTPRAWACPCNMTRGMLPSGFTTIPRAVPSAKVASPKHSDLLASRSSRLDATDWYRDGHDRGSAGWANGGANGPGSDAALPLLSGEVISFNAKWPDPLVVAELESPRGAGGGLSVWPVSGLGTRP